MKWVVTGGAGFIGTNVVRRLVKEGHQVIVLDNLSRRGVTQNMRFLREKSAVDFVSGDIRDIGFLKHFFEKHRDIDVVLHLAAQVAVTDSIRDPLHDFQVNAAGTVHLCEAIRQYVPETILLNASTNKVYGDLSHLELVEGRARYDLADMPYGIAETEPVDFYSPYGCSKGSAEQYVRDYSRTYGLRTISFRQSCIYGPHQFGLEDQGWVAWFIIAAMLDRPIKIYGDGKQVRDLLFVDDLVECYLRAVDQIEDTMGGIYNVGGGPANTLSLLELIEYLERVTGRRMEYTFEDWRPGDQRIFICDIRKAKCDYGWEATIPVMEGLGSLIEWVYRSQRTIREVLEGEVVASEVR